MARKAYARRYAQAIFEIALEKEELEQWQSDLQKMVSAIGDTTLLAALESPKLKFDDKTGLLSKRLGDVNPLALNLVHLLIARASIGLIGDIADEYQRLLDSYHGIEPAEVITAVPLDDRDIQKLAEKLSALVSKKVVLKSEVDPEIIGGIVAADIEWVDGMEGETFQRNLNALLGDRASECGLALSNRSFDTFDGRLTLCPKGQPLAFFIFRLLQQLQSLGTVPAIDWNRYANLIGGRR